jgi:hypothetical protein
MKGITTWENELKPEFRNCQYHISVNCAKPSHKLNASVAFPAFFQYAVHFKFGSVNSPVSLPYFIC